MNATMWPTLILVLAAAVTDLRSRRIPNWLVLPFLGTGLVTSAAWHGLSGLQQSVGGIALAIVALGWAVWLRGMGMGDLKLCAAVGAWIGPGQLIIALVAMGVTGGVMAVIYALRRGTLSESLDGMNDLVAGLALKRANRPIPNLRNAPSRAMPYGPAIAIGTLFSFLAS